MQVVCAQDVLFEATVTAAEGTCRKGDTSTSCTGAANALLLDLRIARVLARKDSTSMAWSVDMIPGASFRSVYVSGFGSAPSEGSARVTPFVLDTSHSGAPERRFIESAMTSDGAVRVGNASLLGGTFVFGMSSSRAALDRRFAHMWTLDREGELLDLLERTTWPGCLRVVEGIR